MKTLGIIVGLAVVGFGAYLYKTLKESKLL